MIAVVFNTLYALLLLTYLYGWRKSFLISVEPAATGDLPFVSVIIPVRDEAMNIEFIFRSLIEQNYPTEKCEWIFVDDHSVDTTVEWLIRQKDQRCKFFSLKSDQTGKKAALKAGVEMAKGEWILTTDADCTLPSDWIMSMVSYGWRNDAMMVCGLVKVEEDQKVVTAFQSMETGVLQFSGVGSLAMGRPLLNTGASLAFRKSAWEEVQGYQSNEHVASGDDTFLMLSFDKHFPGKVLPLVAHAATVSTRGMKTMKEVLYQRLRWNGKVKHYPPGYIHGVGILVMTAALSFLFSFFQLISGFTTIQCFLSVLLLRFIPEMIILIEWKKLTTQRFSLISMLTMSIFYPLFTVFSLLIRPFVSNLWKGRKL